MNGPLTPGDELGRRTFRISDVLSGPNFVRALGEHDGPFAQLEGDGGEQQHLVSPAILGFFQVVAIDDFLSMLGLFPGRTLLSGATGHVNGGRLLEHDVVEGVTTFVSDEQKASSSGKTWRRVAIETVFRHQDGRPISSSTFTFMEAAA